MAEVVVVGGGVVGLAIAWRASQRGLTVTVVDPTPGQGASWAAAGMLAPVSEVQYGESALLRLNLAAAERYPSFVAELEQATGRDVGYRTCGTLAVAFDGDDKAMLDELHTFQLSLGLKAERLTGRECRRLESMLAPSVRAGLLVHGDHQVDPRPLLGALLDAAAGCGVEIVTRGASAVIVDHDRVEGVELDDGSRLSAPTVVLAAGCWSARMAGLPPESVPPVRPVKGQILRLRGPHDPSLLAHNLRCLVAGASVYLVPRADGQVVIGATVEERGFDATVTAGGVRQLLQDAWQVVPGIAELELVECRAGLRPGSPDNAPMLGPAVGVEGLVIAAGHYRNGILLTPVTADSVAELLVTGHLPDIIGPFTPGRFA